MADSLGSCRRHSIQSDEHDKSVVDLVENGYESGDRRESARQSPI